MHEILHSLEHAFFDSLKMLPFLIIAFAVLEILETKLEEKALPQYKKQEKQVPPWEHCLG